MAQKRPRKGQPAPFSPLDAKRAALAEEERKLHEEIARRQRLIEEAPKIQREQEKQRREELVARASRTEARFGPRTALQDTRFAYDAIATVGRGRRLKREQRRGMLTFFVLLATLGAMLAWLYFAVLRGF